MMEGVVMHNMRKRLIVANWKMNPQTYSAAESLAGSVAKSAAKLRSVDVVLCPPYVWLADLASKYGSRVVFGSQDVFWQEQGAYTGEVSPRMLKHVGARAVIIGHSERRRYLGETDEMVNRKVHAAMKRGLRVILCIGETLAERRRGHTPAVLRLQLKKDLAGIAKSHLQGSRVVIAYEPVWAIGTGLPETPKNANAAAAFIRKVLGEDIRVLYGGSVNARNIGNYLAMPEISGALVGGASLRPPEFIKMLEIADAIK